MGDDMIKLVIVRHGQSVWNLENKFTGWTDVDLSDNGVNEAIEAGKVLKEKGFSFDVAFTSVLKRANRTLDLILNELDEKNIPIYKSWRLNERHYGALQGLNKAETAEKYLEMKGYYSEYVPHTECLKDTIERVIPYWDSDIKPALEEGKKVIIVAHGNSLRGLMKYLDNMSDEEVINLEIETGNPICYELNDDFTPIKHYYLK